MAKTVIEISDERLGDLEPYKDKLGELLLLGLSQIKIQESLLLYQRGLVSFGRAAELAGLPEQEMIRQARAFGVYPAGPRRWQRKRWRDRHHQLRSLNGAGKAGIARFTFTPLRNSEISDSCF